MLIYDLFPSPYVRAGDLPANGIVVTIKNIVIEDLRNNKTKKIERKPVMYFRGAKKGMVLNKTNGFIIASLYGPEMDGWAGQRIELYPTRVEAFGSMQDAIRVRERRYEPQSATPVELAQVLESPEDILDHEPEEEDVDGDFRTVDAATGEITSAPAAPAHPAPSAPSTQATDGADIDGDELFERAWYVTARDKASARILCDEYLALHRNNGGPASGKAYGYLVGLIDQIVEQATSAKDGHKRVLPVLCQMDVTGDNRPSATMVGRLLARLATHIKDAASGQKVANPDYDQVTADAMVAIYRAAEQVGTPTLFAA